MSSTQVQVTQETAFVPMIVRGDNDPDGTKKIKMAAVAVLTERFAAKISDTSDKKAKRLARKCERQKVSILRAAVDKLPDLLKLYNIEHGEFLN